MPEGFRINSPVLLNEQVVDTQINTLSVIITLPSSNTLQTAPGKTFIFANK